MEGITIIRTLPGSVLFTFQETAKLVAWYLAVEVEAEFDRAFLVRRLASQRRYHARRSEKGWWTCECLGFLSSGRCRHSLALDKVIRAEGHEHG